MIDLHLCIISFATHGMFAWSFDIDMENVGKPWPAAGKISSRWIGVFAVSIFGILAVTTFILQAQFVVLNKAFDFLSSHRDITNERSNFMGLVANAFIVNIEINWTLLGATPTKVSVQIMSAKSSSPSAEASVTKFIPIIASW